MLVYYRCAVCHSRETQWCGLCRDHRDTEKKSESKRSGVGTVSARGLSGMPTRVDFLPISSAAHHGGPVRSLGLAMGHRRSPSTPHCARILRASSLPAQCVLLLILMPRSPYSSVPLLVHYCIQRIHLVHVHVRMLQCLYQCLVLYAVTMVSGNRVHPRSLQGCLSARETD